MDNDESRAETANYRDSTALAEGQRNRMKKSMAGLIVIPERAKRKVIQTHAVKQ